MKHHKGFSLVLALMLVLPLPLMTNAFAASNTATPTQSLATDSSIEVAGFPTSVAKKVFSKASLAAAVVYEVAYEGGKRARKWTRYRDSALVQFDNVLLPETSLD